LEYRSRFNRRLLLGVAAQTAALTVTARTLKGGTPLDGPFSLNASDRLQQCFQVRMNAAREDQAAGMPVQITNGDENRYSNRIGNYSKGLPHNAIGEVDPAAYQSLLRAVSTGNPQDFDRIVMGGSVKLVDPQAGLAFDMEGLDSHQFKMDTSPALASAERAGEAVEVYWMALLRDVNFADYATSPLALAASADLSRSSDFRGPKEGNKVTTQTLFRGFTPGDVTGPYVSQFLLKPLEYGAIHIDQKINTYLPVSSGGADYMTDPASWRAVQNGTGPFGSNRIDPVPRYIRNGRDLAAYVHIDVLFEAYMNACLWLIDNGAPLNPGNPYRTSSNQTGFGTFGAPYIKALVAEAASRALKAAWYQKWFVHRALRPEEYCGRVHFTKTGAARYPLHSDILNSDALARVVARTGTWLLPHAFPEGCPQHPTYAAGHATVAGACATLVKAFFDDTASLSSMTDIVQAASDGLSLTPYTGSDRNSITIGGEMDKVAANIAIGRNHAGVHWRSDYADSLLLGEAVAISILRDQKSTYNESFNGYTFTKFDGSRITV
jgi:hypothetical protein